MIRKIIKIDEDKCNGCTLCAKACHEGAIGIVNGKAKLLRDDYCDGLGDCLPVCPTGAISFVEREALAYDEEAVKRNMKACSGGCPGSQVKVINKVTPKHNHSETQERKSELRQWPIQLKLVPIQAEYFNDAHLVIAADCSAFAYGNFHQKFLKNKICLIGCPKLDEGDYAEKLTEILRNNSIKSVTVIRMEVPCCGGLTNATIQALQNSGKMIPWHIVTISINGEIIEE